MSSGRPTGCISIPIEIIPSSNSNFYSRSNKKNLSTQQTLRTNYPSSDFTNSPPRIDLKGGFQPRQTSTMPYNRSMKASEFYDDPLSINPKASNSRLESDFIRPSHDYRVPTNQQGIFPNSHDRSRSPGSQRSESPVRPPPPAQESDFKISKDAPPPPPPSSDQQVPSTDVNTIALEKLEQIKQKLADLHQQVDAFAGSTRDDRLYKELDEQAVKLMIRCDELLDVSSDIKEKRKEMIQNVQTIVALLESKVPLEIESNETPSIT